MKGLFFGLIIGWLLGCGADEDSISKVTIDLIEQKDNEIWLRLNVDPAPTSDLAILIETQALGIYGDEYEIGHAWLMVSQFANSRDFKFDLDPSVPWEVRILLLAGKNLGTYPIKGTEVPVGYEFKQYGLGDISSVRTEQVSTQLIVDWPRSGGVLDSLPANAILTFIFNRAPEDITVSHGNFKMDGNRVIVEGFFPLGDIEVELRWNQGRQHFIWYKFITDPDFEPPEILQTQVYFNDGRVWTLQDDRGFSTVFGEVGDGWFWNIQDGWEFSPDTNEIRINFTEKISFHEQVTGLPDIQTEDGTKLGWRAEKVLPKADIIKIYLSDGQPLKPQTTYIIAGTVTDFANETEIKIPFTTLDR